jgi:hypothetical protein
MFEALFDPEVLLFLIPVLMLAGWIVMIVARHRERMAMIERGVNPDGDKARIRR